VSLGGDDDHSIFGQSAASQTLKPMANHFRKTCRAPYVETKLHCAFDLLDVLAASTGCSKEVLMHLRLV
jgi:hypothetical protein